MEAHHQLPPVTPGGNVVKSTMHEGPPCKCGSPWRYKSTRECVDCRIYQTKNWYSKNKIKKAQIDKKAFEAKKHGYLVYFIWDGNLIKIGHTNNLRHRLTKLGNNPNHKILLTLYLGSSKEEAATAEALIQQMFVSAQEGHEWYRPTRELVAFIAKSKPNHCGTPGVVAC